MKLAGDFDSQVVFEKTISAREFFRRRKLNRDQKLWILNHSIESLKEREQSVLCGTE